jgi:hypothetical protein
MLATVGFWIAVVDLACWGIFFVWMHRISRRKNAVLDGLRDQARRIELIAREERKLVKVIHPAVNELDQKVDDVHRAIKD